MRLCFISNPNLIHTRRWVGWFAQRGHEVSLVCDTPLDPALFPAYQNQETWPLLNESRPVTLFDLTATSPNRAIARFAANRSQAKRAAAGRRWPGKGVLKYLMWGIRLRKIIRSWSPDILHAHRITSAGWLGVLSGFHPLVVTPWGSDIYQYPYRARWAAWLTRRVLTQADLITANSQHLRQQAITFGGDPARIPVIQWGVDLNLFSPPPDTPAGRPACTGDFVTGTAASWRERLGLGDAPVVLSIRGVHPIYNLDILIAAIPAVLAQIPSAVFVFRNYNTDPAYKAHLEVQIAALGLQPALRWIDHLEPWERNAEVYRFADLAVSIPSSDGTPVSVLEAMACGVPVIASDLPPLHEWITSGENGLLVPLNPQDLAQAILRLLQDPALQARCRQQNLAMVRARADHQAEMEKMEKLYQSLL